MTTWKDPEITRLRALMAERAGPAGTARPGHAERRAAMDAMGQAGKLPGGCGVRADIMGGVPGERLEPETAVAGRVLLYLHGGAYTVGSPRSHRPMVARLAHNARTAAVVADYRLGPEHPFPAAVDDAEAAYRSLLESHAPGQIVVAGDSAGGGLSLALLLRAKAKGLPQPAGCYVMSPWADLTQSGASYLSKAATDPSITKAGLDTEAGAYLGGADPRRPEASPVFGDFDGAAPVFIQTGSEEALLSDSVTMADVLAQARVAVRLDIWPEMIHVFQAWGGQLAAARRALVEAGAWIDARFEDSVRL